MISAGDFRNGVTLEIEGNVYQILEFQHVKPGKGAAFVRTKLKNIINGGLRQLQIKIWRAEREKAALKTLGGRVKNDFSRRF